MATGRKPTPTALKLVCAWCGETFERKPRSSPKTRCCSVDCRNRLAYAERKAAPPSKACERCGTLFTPTLETGRYCSRHCAGIVNATNRRTNVICRLCGEVYETAVPRHRTCPACAYRARIERTVRRNWLRKAHRRGAFGPSHTERDWTRLLSRHRGLCAYCGIQPATQRDHIIPIARGGTDSIGNILPVCAACNMSKATSFVVEWRRRTGVLHGNRA